jgi:putative transposase
MFVLEYKIKADKETLFNIDNSIRTVQFIRNKCLNFWMNSNPWDNVNGFALNKYSTKLRKEFDFVKALNSMAVQASAERAWSAIQRFYTNCKKNISGKKGYPRFQKDNRSVEFKTSGWKLMILIKILHIKGIGRIKLIGSWDIATFKSENIKRVRLVRKADGYYCQFIIKAENKETLEPTGNQIGIDVGLESFLTDSNGNKVENPRLLRKAERKLKRLQRRVSKKVKGSKNRIKARKRLALKHLKIQRQRKDFVVKTARALCQSNDLIVLEDLKIRNMVKNHKLAKSISDASWGLFRIWLEYFGSKFGREVLAVNPKFTSQKCSSCNQIVKKSLSTRTHICSCGCRLDRDENAAINILNLGFQARIGHIQSNA